MFPVSLTLSATSPAAVGRLGRRAPLSRPSARPGRLVAVRYTSQQGRMVRLAERSYGASALS
jgi:hypothetical protein